MNEYKEKLLLLKRGSTQEEAYAFFDALPPAEEEMLLGLWRGSELPTGHPMDGLLSVAPWFGKRFADRENVDPLVMQDRQGLLYRVNPDALLQYADAAMRIAYRPRQFDEHLLDGVMKLFRTGKSKARLREVCFRGVTSAAMIYDGLGIIDHFRRVDDDTLLGVMDLKGKLHDKGYFFVLQRQDAENYCWL